VRDSLWQTQRQSSQMTALKDFDRLEATGLWRASPEDQRREVIVSLGDATLTMSDMNNQALAHWSLAAVQRANGSDIPAIYHPDGDPGETLELPEDEAQMIEGIDYLLRVIERRRPHPGKLRWFLGVGLAAALAAGAVFWLPGALRDYTVSVLPPVKRAEIGQALLGHMARVTGQPCHTEEAAAPLSALKSRLFGEEGMQQLVVVPAGVQSSAHLPGGIILLNRSVVEDHEDPDVVAGYVLAQSVAAEQSDPLIALVDHAGLIDALRVLATGALPDATLASYAEELLKQPVKPLDAQALLPAFERAELRSSPYAYALDITGETVLPLIEADPRRALGSREVLKDADWVRLQGICGG
jgi:hypothetical protein